MLTSTTLVVLPATMRNMSTQVVIAGSDPVLSGALRRHPSGQSPETLRSHIQVKSLTSNLLSISAQGKTAAQAESTANAVAQSYVDYVDAARSSEGGTVQARMLAICDKRLRTSRHPCACLVWGGWGRWLGLLIGVIVRLAIRRGDRRLRERDEIADSIGTPVSDIRFGRSPIRHYRLDEAHSRIRAWSRRCMAHA